MISSMLLDFVFGQEAGVSGPEMDAFLSMREDLRRARHGQNGVADVFGRLAQAGLWARIYSAADLVQALRAREASDEAAMARQILLGLTTAEDETLNTFLAAAIRDAAAASRGQEIFQSLEAAANRWLQLGDHVPVSDRLDYSDVEVFAAPALLLALAAVVGREATVVVPVSGALAAVGARAMAGSYGRLAFNFSVDWAFVSPELFDPDVIGSALRGATGKRILTSPDVMRRLAEWTFLGGRSNPDPEALQASLERELISLHEFSRLFDDASHAEVGLVLWQNALLEMMLDADLDAGARALSLFWVPRILRSELHCDVRLPVDRVTSDQRRLHVQNWIRPPGPKLELEIRPAPDASLADAWPILSPYLAERTWARHQTAHRLRWLCGLFLALRILDARSFDRVSDPFATYVLSSLPLLRPYRNFSSARDISAWRADVSALGNLGWLARQAWNASLTTLNGLGRVRCEDLLFAIEDACAEPPAISDRDPADFGEKLVGFRQRLTTGALRLLEGAVAASSNVASSPWLDAAEAVISAQAAQSTQDLSGGERAPAERRDDAANASEDLILYGLVRRYLTPTSPLPNYVDETILDTVERGHSWAVLPRRLLLAPTNDPTLWIGPGDDMGSPSPEVRLARALMRVSAAAVNGDLSPELRGRWRNDLYRILGEITDPIRFDRFARLKLIQMVAEAVFRGDPELLIVVIKTLLHFGGPYHVGALQAAIAAGNLYHAPEVLLAVFGGLTRLADARAAQAAGTTLKDQMLDQLRVACLLADDDTFGQIDLYMRGRAVGEQQSSFEQRRAEVRTRRSGSYTNLMMAADEDWVGPTTADMVAVDPTSGQALLLHRRRSAPADMNAFATGPRAYSASRRLGVIESLAPDEAPLKVRIAPDRVVKTPNASVKRLEFGELVVVETLPPFPNSGSRESGARAVTPLATEPAGDEAAQVTITNGAGSPRAHLQVPGGQRADWTRQTYNFAALFGAGPANYEIRMAPTEAGNAPQPAVARLPELLLDIPEVCSSRPITVSVHAVGRNEGGNLEFLVVETRLFQRYLIWARGGCTPQTKLTLVEELERLENLGAQPEGLLVTLRLARTAAGAALELCTEPEPDGQAGVADLQRPFDYRNIAWRERFSRGIEELAAGGLPDTAAGPFVGSYINPRRFHIEVPAPGPFPDWVDVTLEERCNVREPFLEIYPDSWDPWRATARGVAMDEASLRLDGSGPVLAAQVRAIAAQTSGAELRVMKVVGTIRDDGRVLAFTDANQPILINAETITLALPCDPRRNWPRGRCAEVERAEWRQSGFRVELPTHDIPREAVTGGRAKGIITRLAPVHAQQLTCTVAWLDADGEGITERPLVLRVTRGGRRLWQGAMIDAPGGGGEAVVLESLVIANGVWRQDEVAGVRTAPRENNFVGCVLHQGQTWDVHETGPGRFALAAGEASTTRAALRRQFSLAKDEDDVSALDLTQDRSRDKIWCGGLRRASLRYAEAGLIVGTTPAEVVGGAARLSGLQITLRPRSVGEDWLLGRVLQVLPDRRRQASLSGLTPEPRELADEVVPALTVGEVITGRFDPRTSRLHLKGEHRRHHPDGIPIAGDAIQRAPLFPGAQYPDSRATAVVVGTTPVQASFVAAPQSSLEDLALVLEAARTEPGSLGLDPTLLRLVYAGREGPDVDQKFVFEWGYGQWLALDESLVRYGGQPIETAKLLLFYGDRISAAEVEEDGLHIESIAPSRAHLLYRHSRDHKVVNLLRLRPGREAEPIIEAIAGFDPQVGTQSAGATVPHATLDAEGLDRVRPRLAEASPQTIVARLDTNLFEKSGGRSVVFKYRRLDLADPEFGVKAGDRVFVAAGRIRSLRNDVGLEIEHPGLHEDDAAPEFLRRSPRPVLMLRRAFSIRQQALSDISRVEGPDELQDSVLLVRLDRYGPSLIEGSLPRSPEIVRQRLRRGEEVLGVFGGAAGPDADWVFELSPGVLVGLPQGEVIEGEQFYRGDVVLLRSSGAGLIRLELAAPSDLRFACDQRPVVVLPRDTLARPEALPPHSDRRAADRFREAFSIGYLPDLSVTLRGRRADGGNRHLKDRDFAEFMCRPHPRVGELHLQRRGDVEGGLYVTPGLVGGTRVGRLDCEHDNAKSAPKVSVASMDGDGRPQASDWCFLSYSDSPAAELASRATQGSSEFHDRYTTIWIGADGGDLRPERAPLGPFTASTGPLFFSIRPDGSATLRHSRADLPRFVNGPSALMPLLSGGGRKRPIHASVAHADKDELIVELNPGQLVKIPAGMLRFRTAGGAQPMRALDLQIFAPGDRLTLSPDASTDTLRMLVMSVQWTHHNRNALGPRGGLLELNLEQSDLEGGCAVYGPDAFRISLPTSDVKALPPLAIVGGDHAIVRSPAEPRGLIRRTVILELVPGGVGVHGLPGARFTPDSKWPWDKDPLYCDVVASRGRLLKFDEEKLAARLELAGGALPFTVEHCVDEGRWRLWLSPRHQNVAPEDGQVVRAVVEGQVEVGGRVQLRIGGRRSAMPMVALLSSLKASEEIAIAASLRERPLSAWLTQRSGGLAAGYDVDVAQTQIVTPLRVISQGDVFFGVLCEGLSDGRLFWLPADESGAFPYSGPSAERVFTSVEMQRLKVAVLPSGVVSVVKHPVAANELARMRLGASLFVDPLQIEVERPGWAAAYGDRGSTRACVSKQSSLTFGLVLPAAEGKRGSLQAEVALRLDWGAAPSILLTPANSRVVATEAPLWLFGRETPPWAGEAVRYLAPSREIDGLSQVVESLKQGPDPGSADGLLTMTRAFLISEWVGVLSAAALCAALQTMAAHDTRTIQARINLLRNLFARAVRSQPLEVLASWVLKPPSGVSGFTASRREAALQLFSGGSLDAARLALDRWLGAIELEGVTQQEEALANALGLLIGKVGRPQSVAAQSPFLRRIISATRPIALSADVGIEVAEGATARVLQVAADLIDRQLDLPLLPPLGFPQRVRN